MRARAGGDHQLRELQPRRSRRGRAGDRARRQRVGGRHAGARRGGARRAADALQHRLRVFRHGRRRPTPRSIRPNRKASMRNRSWSASGWPPTRRSTTCCASRACLAGRTAAAASIASSTPCAPGQPAPVFVDRVVSPSFVADVADASAFILRTRPAAGLYHCVNSGHATWLDGRP